MRIKLTILIIGILIQGIHAQDPGFKSFNLTENNHPVKINTVFKTDEGYIFAGTTDGLYAFDGINFKKINFSKPGVKDTVTAIFQDNNRKIWIGFKSGRIAKKINSTLEYFEPEEGNPGVAINSFLQDKENNIWIATNGEGIYHFNNNHLYLIDSANGLSDLHIHALAQAANGDMLAATDAGINICKNVNGKIKVSVIGPNEGLPDYYVTAITAAGKNTFWIGLQEKGFCLYDLNTGKITVPASDSNWKYGQVNALLVSEKNLWIGTEENGLLRKAANNQPAQQYNSKTSSGNKVINLLQDNEGNIWTNASIALTVTAGNQLQLLPLYDKSFFENIHAMLCDYQNNFWINTAGRLIKYTAANGSYTKKDYRFAGLNSNTDITCLYQDNNHNIWIGTMGSGILIMDPLTGKYRTLTENPVLKNATILSITGNGKTVCAGGFEGIAMIFDIDSVNHNIAAPYKFRNLNDMDNIGTNYIYSIYKDTRNRIWFAMGEKGIYVLENGRFVHYGKESGLLDDRIFSITEDKKGDIWFNTKSAGIYAFNGKSFKNYSTANGLSDLEIISLKTGPWGNVIVVNRKGIDVLDVNSGTFFYLDNSQGIADVNLFAGAVTQDTAKNIAFCTSTGIIIYSPVENTNHHPKTIIENVQLFLSDVEKDKPGNYNSDQNTFQFYFTSIYYTNPDEIRYQYKLEGLDTAWISTRDRNVSFLRLQPGKYTFHIKSSLNENFENADEATYDFFIQKPLWKRYWFIALVILLTAGLLYWYIKNRERNLKKMQQLQQEKTQFQFQVLRAQVNPHFLFNSFNTLISYIEEEPAQAVDYVEQLSGFFRNIVNYRDHDVISLGEEFGILKTYFYLQQKRYGANLKLNIQVSEEDKKLIFIPPLTLQLLIENAIKHNAVSKETPLTIDVFMKNGKQLVIKNNINPKITRESGAGMGLQNIVNRYNLLSKEPVTLNNDGVDFTVILPILNQ
ncbi:MAG: two-component regulator propeller domain-containing protein [Ferruginibacter sp.]